MKQIFLLIHYDSNGTLTFDAVTDDVDKCIACLNKQRSKDEIQYSRLHFVITPIKPFIFEPQELFFPMVEL